MDSKKQRRQFLFSNILKLMQTECFPDCKLVTQERIAVEAHKIILFQVPYLRNLLTSIACCEGQCGIQEPVTILLPDVSYTHLEPILHYLYTGVLKFPRSDKAVIRDLLLKTFGVPGERVSPTSRPGDVTCDECSDRVHVTKLFQHVMVKHVKEPFRRDIQLAEEGGAVGGIEAFDETDAIKSVTDHYSNRLKDFLSYLDKEHGIANQLGVATPELWLEKLKQRRANNIKSKPSEEQGHSNPKNVTVPDNGANPHNKENQNLVLDHVTNGETRPDLHRENVRGIKRRRKSKIDASTTQITHEDIKTSDDTKNQTNVQDLDTKAGVQGSKRRRKSQTNASTEVIGHKVIQRISETKESKTTSFTVDPFQGNSTVVSTNDNIGNSSVSLDSQEVLDLEMSILPQTDGNNLSLEKEASAQSIQGRKGISIAKNNSLFVSKANASKRKEKAHQERNKSSRLSLKKKAQPAVASLQDKLKPGKVICQECRAEVSRQTFSKHLVAKHLFKLWIDVKDDETVCRYENCKKVVESSKYLIQHLACTHNEVETKLKEIGKSLTDYEWTNDDNEKEPTKEEDSKNLADIERDNEDDEKANESGSDITMPLGFGEEKRMKDFDD